MGDTEKFQPTEPGGFEEEPQPEQEPSKGIDPDWGDEPEPEPEQEKPKGIEPAGWDDEESGGSEPVVGVVSPPEGKSDAEPTSGHEGSISDIKAWVGDSAQRAQEAMDVEAAKDNPRSKLISWLEDVVRKG